ncbi:MAG: hypothetical protein LUQ38_00580 [Methanotrichaceae archaeon]|nr:hypothetical protein [Methanotrichaceae archaeon]
MPDQERYVYLYCQSREQKKRYERLAEEQCTSLSKFLLNKIEEALNPKPAIDPKNFIALEEENKELLEQLRIQKILAAKFEQDLRKVEETVTVVTYRDDILWDIFRKFNAGELTTDDVSNLSTEQYETLEKVKIVKKTPRGGSILGRSN